MEKMSLRIIDVLRVTVYPKMSISCPLLQFKAYFYIFHYHTESKYVLEIQTLCEYLDV